MTARPPPLPTSCDGPGVRAAQLSFMRRLCSGCHSSRPTPDPAWGTDFVVGWSIEDVDDSDRGSVLICRAHAVQLVLLILEAEVG